LYAAYKWCNFLASKDIADIANLTESDARAFQNEHLFKCQSEGISTFHYRFKKNGINNMIAFLLETSIIEASPPIKNETAISVILSDFDNYLTRLFGIQLYTRRKYSKYAVIFMEWLIEEYGSLDWTKLSCAAVIKFQTKQNEQGVSRRTKQTWASKLRVFLRYLYWNKMTDEDFSMSVFKIMNWSLADIPKFMEFADMQVLLSAPDRATPNGKRDVAMLMLMAQLGFRAMEVIKLRINDIDFRSGVITLRKTKSYKERSLPMSIEIAEALIDYIKNGRRETKEERVFIRTKAPYTALGTSSSVAIMLKKYLKSTDVKHPTNGTHQLRHGLATHLINQNAQIKDIADIFGHASIDTTKVYTKVHIDGLKCVALPFPNMKGDASL